jgi:protocatechuate 3,4-dioxygenase beta subunit
MKVAGTGTGVHGSNYFFSTCWTRLAMRRSLPRLSFDRDRRRFVRGGCVMLAAPGLLVPRAALAAARSPTPAQTEGPFYPKTLPADRDADLTRVAGRAEAARGTRLHLSGEVVDETGRPLPGIAVELWQCDSFGRYHHAGDEGRPRDDNFQGFGISATDERGRYAFKTIRPVPYGGRPPHLHFRLAWQGRALLTTQLYVEGEASAHDAVIAAAPAGTLARLTIRLAAAAQEPGALAARYDFVLKGPLPA